MSGAVFADPVVGASLLLAFSPPQSPSQHCRRTVLLIGQGRLTATRAFACLEAGLQVLVAVQPDHDKTNIDQELVARLQAGQIQSVFLPHDHDATCPSYWRSWLENDIDNAILEDIALVCVTDTLSTGNSVTRSAASAAAIRNACYTLRMPINVADHPELSDFRFPATYRFPRSAEDRTPSPLQIAITTNASSCRLSSRIRREIVHKLPRGIGSAVEKVGRLRERARAIDRVQSLPSTSQLTLDTDLSYITSRPTRRASFVDEGEQEEGWSSTLLNKPVPQIPVAASVGSRSKCTSPKLASRRLLLASTPLHLKPDYIPLLTPPATPPPESIANRMDDILSGHLDELPRTQHGQHDQTRMRMRFIAQISEYWPLDKLAAMTDQEADRVISLYAKASHDEITRDASSSCASEASESSTVVPSVSSAILAHGGPARQDVPSRHDLQLSADSSFASPPNHRGQIFLLGSGPGSPALLTLAAHELLTKKATLILSDKLVPSEILALIPSSTPLTIAKKFPGNAEGAQNELMDLALEGARRGEIVVRLKQGDPYVYGRGGEEVLFFRERGFEAVVVPGISSAFAAPLMAGIPVTQRGVSESVVVCTGVGRKGKGVKLPGYERSRTTVVLMGVARLQGVVHALTSAQGQEEHGRDGGARDGAPYPPYCPIAIIEKASSPDQRMVASTLEGIVNAMERAGEQRPPGMMIIGWSALALEGEGDVQVLDGVDELSTEELEAVDRKRIQKWLGPKGWIMREGLDPSWSTLVGGVDSASISDITAL